jgi:hypothetical protein
LKKYKTVAAMAFLLNLVICSLAMAQSPLPKCPEDKSNGWSECFGAIKLSDGDTYIGEWRGGRPNGQGTATLGKDKYVGAWKDGQYSGYGTYFFADGSPPKQGIWANGEFIRAEKAPAQQNISLAEASKDSQKKGSRYCFQTFGFKNPLKIDTCDANLILINLKKGSGLVTIGEFIEPSSFKTTYIYPAASSSSREGFIEETIVKYKRLASKFEMENKDGCIYRGDFKEAKTTIIETYRTISGTCSKTEKDMFEAYLKNEPTTYTKIFY